jgi:hypothetical protein
MRSTAFDRRLAQNRGGRLRRTVLLGCLAVYLAATETPETPIPAEMRAIWWRRVAEQAAAKIQFDRATFALEAARAEMAKACSDRPLVVDAQGEPACGDKPQETVAK